MFQEVVVGLIFLAALGYVVSLVYKNMQAKNACATGCSKCGAVDLEKIEKQIAAAQPK
ncbi:MAG TPA: FeoB-associated Cys-rich membrane protein [Cyclobacteriaceae bacterium]|nr:FeoB-associated Cys-rich membrane protein [Cyclobacteriaceae bacterium]